MNTYFQQVNQYLTMMAQQESNQLMHIAKQIVKRLTKGALSSSLALVIPCY
ncbi:hypothetical protein [Lysinibacillus sp. FN11]|uniref:hypothetical protein n=1 Tax=Lysinibacillus sp. FN11 TaxID=2968499 RepID=UPI00214AF60A|nr:hypothetical protein NP781_07460 [Lysinibacillus sp. FN11]